MLISRKIMEKVEDLLIVINEANRKRGRDNG